MWFQGSSLEPRTALANTLPTELHHQPKGCSLPKSVIFVSFALLTQKPKVLFHLLTFPYPKAQIQSEESSYLSIVVCLQSFPRSFLTEAISANPSKTEAISANPNETQT